MNCKGFILFAAVGLYLLTLNAEAIRFSNVRDAAEDLLFHAEPSIEKARYYVDFVNVPETDPSRKKIRRSSHEAKSIVEGIVACLKNKNVEDQTDILLKKAINIADLYQGLSEEELVPFSFILETVNNKID